uniref:DNA mismatch repair proteins mutS family domain-containing protein n=1 Tax=viral metagenome TaxID=1070528 RepID=A0A6C0D2I5_9ZZZZ
MSSCSSSISFTPLLKYYFEEQQKVEKEYGKCTVLCFMVGKFYEIYELEGKGFAQLVSEKCNIILTRKNKNLELSPSNPYMCGFPVISLCKYIKRLHTMGYTVAVYDQNQNSEKDEDGISISRSLSGVYTPSSPVDLMFSNFGGNEMDQNNNNNSSNGLFCIWKEQVNDVVSNHGRKRNMLYNGYSVYIEFQSGEVIADTWSSSTLSSWRSEALLLMERYHPREIYMYPGMEEEQELWKRKEGVKLIPPLQTQDWDLRYQAHVLEKVFLVEKSETLNLNLQIHEKLHLERCPEWTAMFVHLLNYLYQHHPLLVFRLKPPVFSPSLHHVRCNQDVFHELNIFSGSPSLFMLTDKTCTSWGSRLWRRQLMTPTTNTINLERRWCNIQELLEKSKEERVMIKKSLQTLPTDPWILWRQWECKKYSSPLTMIQKMYSILHHVVDCIHSKNMYIPSFQQINDQPFYHLSLSRLGDAILYFENVLVMEIMEGQTAESLSPPVLVWRSSQPIKQEMEKEWETCKRKMTDSDYLSWFDVKWKEEEEEIYLQLPNANAKKRMYTRKAEAEKILREHRWYSVGTKWFHPDLVEAKQQYLEKCKVQSLQDKVEQEQCMEEFYNLYSPLMEEIWYWMGHWDVVQSCTQVCWEYRYVKPRILDQKETRQLQTTQLRHPILERVHEHVQFIGNDLKLYRGGVDNEHQGPRGMLMYGHNSAGKSTFLKSVGLGIWLAQVGMYVPADEFEFIPFTKLFSKMGASDNLYKGHSTFVVEMMELRHFLHYADSSTLLLCDELTAGTETSSASGIVASTISHLLHSNSYFLFTTHLHTLQTFTDIFQHPKLSVVHFPMERKWNETRQEWEWKFGRRYIQGIGPMLYGIEIAETLDMDSEFIQKAFHYRQQLLLGAEEKKTMELLLPSSASSPSSPSTGPLLIPTKKSRYHSGLYMMACTKCGSKHNLHTHHRTPQKEATKDGYIGNFHKNALFNLQVLCNVCHEKEHK